jgi:hypothetical protein
MDRVLGPGVFKPISRHPVALTAGIRLAQVAELAVGAILMCLTCSTPCAGAEERPTWHLEFGVAPAFLSFGSNQFLRGISDRAFARGNGSLPFWIVMGVYGPMSEHLLLGGQAAGFFTNYANPGLDDDKIVIETVMLGAYFSPFSSNLTGFFLHPGFGIVSQNVEVAGKHTYASSGYSYSLDLTTGYAIPIGIFKLPLDVGYQVFASQDGWYGCLHLGLSLIW